MRSTAAGLLVEIKRHIGRIRQLVTTAL